MSSIKASYEGYISSSLKVCVVDFNVYNGKMEAVLGKWESSILQFAIHAVDKSSLEGTVSECTNKIVPMRYRGGLPNLTSQNIVLTLFDHESNYDETWDSNDISDSDTGIDENVNETEDLNDPQTGSNAFAVLDDSFEDCETITEDPDDDDSGESTEDELDGPSLKFEEVQLLP